MTVTYQYDKRDGRCLTPCPHRHFTEAQIAAYASFKTLPRVPTEAPMAGSAACRECEYYGGETGQKIDCKHPESAALARHPEEERP